MAIAIEYWVLGGAAGDNGFWAGGSGAGGLATGSITPTVRAYAVVVGAGGTPGNFGNNSSFDGITGNGGGLGGADGAAGSAGGCGGGCGRGSATPGGGSQGGQGGGTVDGTAGGGGGGLGGNGGASGGGVGGNGGAPISNNWDGTARDFGGGGAGRGGSSPAGKGANRGFGGEANSGQSGDSGIVRVRYLISTGIVATGGTISTVGLYKLHDFTGVGASTFTVLSIPSGNTVLLGF